MKLGYQIIQNTPSQGIKPERFQWVALLPSGFNISVGALYL